MSPSSRTALALTLVAACALACAANDFPGNSAQAETAASDSTSGSWAAACDVALQQLDALLAARDSDPAAYIVDLVEARSLRREAIDLMAASEYELAFDMIARAISVLEQAP
jgi:invasion protein IalB